MIKAWIEAYLNGKIQKKKHEIIKLQWEKAELEKELRRNQKKIESVVLKRGEDDGKQ